MSKILILAAVIFVAFILGYIFYSNTATMTDSTVSTNNSLAQNTPTLATEIEAYFAIFTNGTFRIFTSPMYHNLSPDAYIEANNPHTVHVKKAGITWGDFFSTLPFELRSDCLTTGTGQTFCTGDNGTLKFYINGVQDDDALSAEIKDGDKLLVTFGTESEEEIRQQLNTEVLR